MGNAEHLIDPAPNGIPDTLGLHGACRLRLLLDLRLENHALLPFEFHLDFEQGRLVGLPRIDLLVEVLQGEVDRSSDALNNDGVDVFCVVFPFGQLSVDFDGVVYLLQQFVDGSTAFFDGCEFVGDDGAQDVVVLLGGNGFVLALHHWLLEFQEFIGDVLQTLLHLIHDFIK